MKKILEVFDIYLRGSMFCNDTYKKSYYIRKVLISVIS
jgi:hypothetical protein